MRRIFYIPKSWFLVLSLALSLSAAAETLQDSQETSESDTPELTEDFSEDELYLEARAPYDSAGLFETKITAGLDVNNPYLTLYSLSAAETLVFSPYLSFGVQGSKFISVRRSSTVSLENNLGAYGFAATLREPDWSAVAVFGVTPFSGMMSLFGGSVAMFDVTLLGRFGVVQYLRDGLGPTAGLGLEFHTGFSAVFGFNIGVHWDVDKPKSTTGISRVGLRVGPTVRF